MFDLKRGAFGLRIRELAAKRERGAWGEIYMSGDSCGSFCDDLMGFEPLWILSASSGCLRLGSGGFRVSSCRMHYSCAVGSHHVHLVVCECICLPYLEATSRCVQWIRNGTQSLPVDKENWKNEYERSVSVGYTKMPTYAGRYKRQNPPKLRRSRRGTALPYLRLTLSSQPMP